MTPLKPSTALLCSALISGPRISSRKRAYLHLQHPSAIMSAPPSSSAYAHFANFISNSPSGGSGRPSQPPVFYSPPVPPQRVTFGPFASPQQALADLKRRFAADQIIRAKGLVPVMDGVMQVRIRTHPGFALLDGISFLSQGTHGSRYFVSMDKLVTFYNKRQYFTLTGGAITNWTDFEAIIAPNAPGLSDEQRNAAGSLRSTGQRVNPIAIRTV